MLITAVSLSLAALVGFASHRASLCTVRAVGELMSRRSSYLLQSFGKAVLWATLAAGTLTLWIGVPAPATLTRIPIPYAIFGGFLFGIGAAINGGCSLSTLQRLAEGDLSMLVTLLAFGIGVLSWDALQAHLAITHLAFVASRWARWPGAEQWLLGGLWIWASWELISLARPLGARSLRERLLTPTYRLSTAAAMLGIAGGALYGSEGAWTYTNFLRAEVSVVFGGVTPSRLHATLVLALLAGMLLSAWERRSLALRSWRHEGKLHLRFAGGWLMGVGGALVPGGNDTLLLGAMPSLSLPAVGAYAAMLSGIAATLAVMHRLQMPMAAVHCAADECIEVPLEVRPVRSDPVHRDVTAH